MALAGPDELALKLVRNATLNMGAVHGLRDKIAAAAPQLLTVAQVCAGFTPGARHLCCVGAARMVTCQQQVAAHRSSVAPRLAAAPPLPPV
jgi:hypothetical protein